MIKRAREILPRNTTITFWDKAINDISPLSNLANPVGDFVERVADGSHKGVELKIPTGELASILRLAFDETHAENVWINGEVLGGPEVGDTSSWQ